MFQLSPGVNVSEIDLATGIPGVSTTEAGMAGVFRWGPVNQRMLVTSEPDLRAKVHKPTNFNAETWFVAASFLSYGNSLHLVRVSNGTSAMAVFSGTTAPNAALQTVKNKDDYDAGVVTFSANVGYVAKYPGELGNSLRVSVCDSVNTYSSTVNIIPDANTSSTSNVAISVGSTTAVVSVGFAGSGNQTTSNTQATAVKTALVAGDNIKVGNSSIGTQFIKIASIGSVTGNSTISTFTITLAEPYRLHTDWSSNTINRYWEFHSLVDSAPGTSEYVESFGNTAAVDEMHIVVVDEDGAINGTPGGVLEVYRGLSRATDAKLTDGTVNYYKTRLNNESNYIWWANDRTGAASATSNNVASSTNNTALNLQMVGGTDGDGESAVALATIARGYDLLAAADQVDISLVMVGKARESDGHTLANYVIDNVTEARKDCIAFISPPKETVVNNVGSEVDDLVSFAGELRSSSYAFLDSGYKYQYDKYNDVYRWIPLNGDIAGLCVRTDTTHDAWWSPAGYNRGAIKNVIRLAFNPTKADRDQLYKAAVNPVITERGAGTLLFGDKTLLNKNSPFSRINVRRLFIVLEKAIATDAKFMLFEFNDEFTRAQFRNRTNPYLRDIKGRRGVTDFLVVCDESNNTAEIIDNEEFVGDIYIKANMAINNIQLNFVSVRGSVTFNEIVNQF